MIINESNIEQLLPFVVHDGHICNVKWYDEELYIKIEACGDENGIRKTIELCFYGVDWIRSVCDEKHDGYVEGTSFDEYPLIDREKLNENYIEFVCYGLLDGFSFMEEGVVCLEQVFFFNTTAVDILKINE